MSLSRFDEHLHVKGPLHKEPFYLERGRYSRCCPDFAINSISDLIFSNVQIVDRDFIIYEPSTGDKIMLLQYSKLMDDTKNVFIQNAQEAKVGHKYINDIMFPRLIELARRDKIIGITTQSSPEFCVKSFMLVCGFD